jgi:signal recognition particle subunit SRP54
VFEMGNQANPVDIAKAGIAEAKKRKVDAVIVDTAGRLQVGAQDTGCLVLHAWNPDLLIQASKQLIS